MAKVKKKRNKKYNPRAKAELIIKAALKNTGMVYTTGGGRYCTTYNLRTGVQTNTTEAEKDALAGCAHEWSVYLAAFCRDQTGAEYMKSEIAFIEGKQFHEDICRTLNEHHFKLLRGCNDAHLIGAGWVAMPRGADLSEEIAAKIFEHQGVWEVYQAQPDEVDQIEEIRARLLAKETNYA